ncbi:MAG TPA: GH3 auxin-responsive promoter family protein [Thermoanaerobaculia bacterium]|nr:GH3 auxin-responsive promoter family protein [Thermoanaerobaculia bacterium]
MSTPWLEPMLARNAETAYLRKHGSPLTMKAFREQIPVISYEDLTPWIDRIRSGERDVLFAGSPVAFERTGGSTGAAKLIPYSEDGLHDFQRAVVPWLKALVETHGITGRAYFSISPATRPPESIGGIPVGLPDGAYLGAAGAAVLEQVTAVPFAVAAITDVARWRTETSRHLAAARDLELIAVWSPTFLLALLDGIGDPRALWPRLKVVSCWAAAASKPFADSLAARLPHAHLQPKGLLSTETVVTIPDRDDRPVLTEHGFFEFEQDGQLHLQNELTNGSVYEVVATTASGLYRYRTGDLVRYEGQSDSGRPILEFVGRGNAVSDLVGEKLTEPFVASCLATVPGFRLLVPARASNGYVLMTEAGAPVSIEAIERRLCDNPQYAYARRIGQLEALRLMPIQRLYDRYARAQTEEGVRLGDVKPAALRNERAWVTRLGEQA